MFKTIMIASIPFIFLVILYFFINKRLNAIIQKNKRVAFCELVRKEKETLRVGMTSPNFKTYIFHFRDMYGNRIKVQTNDTDYYNTINQGDRGNLTYSGELFIQFLKADD
ncbi:DUF2500 family protein [Paenibacillus turpanensis]|uniref:DUF2500 family protein n=1 Tax=Paenibacillus turpanensis TaxID=2689078 RepID=UPI00140A006A|nr:DUF2500 family protein [Paenibacillus turpanensis]